MHASLSRSVNTMSRWMNDSGSAGNSCTRTCNGLSNPKRTSSSMRKSTPRELLLTPCPIMSTSSRTTCTSPPSIRICPANGLRPGSSTPAPTLSECSKIAFMIAISPKRTGLAIRPSRTWLKIDMDASRVKNRLYSGGIAYRSSRR